MQCWQAQKRIPLERRHILLSGLLDRILLLNAVILSPRTSRRSSDSLLLRISPGGHSFLIHSLRSRQPLDILGSGFQFWNHLENPDFSSPRMSRKSSDSPLPGIPPGGHSFSIHLLHSCQPLDILRNGFQFWNHLENLHFSDP